MVNVYLNRNYAKKFFSTFGNIQSVRLGQNKNGELAWIHSCAQVARISRKPKQCEEVSKQDAVRFRSIAPNTSFIYEGRLYLYKLVRTKTNACIVSLDIISCGRWLRYLFPKAKNISYKFFAVIPKKLPVGQDEAQPINYIWVLYSGNEILTNMFVFQNGEKYSSPADYTWKELNIGDSFKYGAQVFFLHTEKNEPCIREINN